VRSRNAALLLSLLLAATAGLPASASHAPSGLLLEAEPRRIGGRQATQIDLLISEIMYHPGEGGAEFIELSYSGNRNIHIGGVSFTDGIDFDFAPGTIISPGQVLVLARSAVAFNAAYPDVALAGTYDGRLDNAGERVVLSYSDGRSLVELRYDDDVPWPTEADGLGHSMVLGHLQDPGDPLSWCASPEVGGSPGAVEGLSCPARSDPTDPLFAADRVLDVRIQIADEDWQDLRLQERNILDLFVGEDCLAEPFASPFTYFPGTVSVDGEVVGDVGVRKKGFLGSLSREKPSLKLRFDEYVAGQRLSGLRRMTLNNARQDPTYLNQCLGYQLFAAAGVPAPRCNFATVQVNDEELGLYVHVESVRGRLLARHFNRNDGSLFEGTLSDFRPGWTDSFDHKSGSDDRAGIEALAEAAAMPDQQLASALVDLIDIPAFIDFWVMEVMVGHWDGYAGNTNNFFIYRDPDDGLFHFMPWGADALFQVAEDLEGSSEAPTVLAAGVLGHRLYGLDSGRQAYVDRMVELLDLVWDESALLTEIEIKSALVLPHLDSEQTEAFEASIVVMKDFVAGRRAELLAALVPDPPEPEQEPRDPLCFTYLGDLQSAFETTWGTFDLEDPFEAGSGSLDLAIDGQTPWVLSVGSSAGSGEDPERQAVILVAAVLADGSLMIVLVETDPALLVNGGTVEIDASPTLALLLRLSPATGYQPELIGLLANGSMHFDEAGTEQHDPISGTLAGEIYAPFF